MGARFFLLFSGLGIIIKRIRAPIREPPTTEIILCIVTVMPSSGIGGSTRIKLFLPVLF
jgi:hypothetical protein